jgi:hypothetical protein
MVYFQTKNPDLGTFWRILQKKRLVYSMAVWNILGSFGKFCGHLVILWQFGIFPRVLVYCAKKNLTILIDRGDTEPRPFEATMFLHMSKSNIWENKMSREC